MFPHNHHVLYHTFYLYNLHFYMLRLLSIYGKSLIYQSYLYEVSLYVSQQSLRKWRIIVKHFLFVHALKLNIKYLNTATPLAFHFLTAFGILSSAENPHFVQLCAPTSHFDLHFGQTNPDFRREEIVSSYCLLSVVTPFFTIVRKTKIELAAIITPIMIPKKFV